MPDIGGRHADDELEAQNIEQHHPGDGAIFIRAIMANFSGPRQTNSAKHGLTQTQWIALGFLAIFVCLVGSSIAYAASLVYLLPPSRAEVPAGIPQSPIEKAKPTFGATGVALGVSTGTALPSITPQPSFSPTPSRTPLPTSTPLPTAIPLPSPTPIPPYRPLGSKFNVARYSNEWEITVIGAQFASSLAGSGMVEKAHGRFAIVFMNVTNRGFSQATFVAIGITVIKDAAGNVFDENGLATSFAVDQFNLSLAANINPDVTVKTAVVYDISQSSPYYMLAPGILAGKNNGSVLLPFK